MSYNSFSQTATDSTKIVLTKPIAKLVIQDIVVGDQIKLELKTLEELLGQTNNKLGTQTVLVTNLNSQITNYRNIIKDLSTKSSIQKDLSKDLEIALKKANRRTKLYKIGTTVGAVALGLLLIK
jgi:hypothetical protein|tara:strand:+ start:92 stop:463 length:372 start_codon:yes stop_codon:yes gene_type:complete